MAEAMTKAEWLTCKAPKRMFDQLPQDLSERKLRLFACACCRSLWPILTNEKCRQAVEVGERFADGLATEEERALAQDEADQQFRHLEGRERDLAQVASSWAVVTPRTDAESEIGPRFAAIMCSYHARSVRGSRVHGVQASHLRCIFGYPFRRVSVDPAWLVW